MVELPARAALVTSKTPRHTGRFSATPRCCVNVTWMGIANAASCCSAVHMLSSPLLSRKLLALLLLLLLPLLHHLIVNHQSPLAGLSQLSTLLC